MVATATGMHTEIGKIAALMNATGEKKHRFRSAWIVSAAIWQLLLWESAPWYLY